VKILYVPFNNRGLGVDTYEESGFMLDLLDQANKQHVKDGEDAIVLLYVSEADSGFLKPFSKNSWPKWLKGLNMIVRKHFDIDEGNAMALSLAGSDPDNVIEFLPFPNGLMDEEEIARINKKQKEKWGWGYIAPVEKVS
jgi:hypothetical protein